MIKQICILTKSLKDHEYCVAGIDIGKGNWIRLVTSKKGAAFTKELLDDNNLNEFDVVEINLKEHVPYHCQTENWLVDETQKIIKVGKLSKHQIFNLHPIENHDSIFNSTNDVITKEEIKNITHSLEMIKVQNIIFDTSLKDDGRHHYKIEFKYKGTTYNLALTDPDYRKEEIDKMKISGATIIISIPALPYGENDLYYKFVAKIIQ